MDHLTIFIGVTAVAVVLQAGILVAMYLGMRKTSARVEALASEVSSKILPTAELVHSMLSELRPKIESTITNVSETTALVHAQVERMDATITDVIDRTRLQIIRTDELVSRTLDQVEETAEIVTKTIVSPVRRLSGILQGLSVGFETFFGSKRRHRSGIGVPQDEMFI